MRILLSDALAGIGFHRGGKLAILNLACGRADETGAIAAALSPAEIGFYFGIDLRADTITEARSRWSLPSGVIEFRCGDASGIHAMKQLPAADLIFIRHQNYWNDPASWDQLLERALSMLTSSGVLVCTSYFDHEHDLLKAALKTRSAEILWDVRHLSSRPLPEEAGKSVDRHLVIFGKGSEIF